MHVSELTAKIGIVKLDAVIPEAVNFAQRLHPFIGTEVSVIEFTESWPQ
jgi:hypothetical protein